MKISKDLESAASVKPTFIDLFSGCGGLSLGMTNAGFRGIFVVEKAAHAFLTFRSNLLDDETDPRFAWPSWLEKKNFGIEDFLAKYRHRLVGLRGKVSVITGGPPCQGFSMAGLRNGSDPRNRLFRKYVEFVDAVRPQMIVFENVPGMKLIHGVDKRQGKKTPNRKPKSYYEKFIEALSSIGYLAEGRLLDATSFGVPQRRPRLVVVGMKRELLRGVGGFDQIFNCIASCAEEQICQLGLREPVSAKHALSDLETAGRKLIPCTDPVSPPRGYLMLQYSGPLTNYQRLMNCRTARDRMDSMRLAKHGEKVIKRFTLILDECRRGVQLSDADRERYGMSKHRTLPMSPTMPAPTLTTLPDDVLHYSEPRILTVREYARIQSFPDWYQFKGKYTTGGERRKKDCPRYTQIGNAVPPLLAEGVGRALVTILQDLAKPKVHDRAIHVQTQEAVALTV